MPTLSPTDSPTASPLDNGAADKITLANVDGSDRGGSDLNGAQVLLSGFRLERLEVLNWGTFDQRPWTLNLNGGTALLTGANGSGKSTLVDALLTLLVPNRRRSYNQASSGTSKKKERDEKSYVQGAYARTRSEESYSSRSKYLREKGCLSILMAYFCDRTTQKEVSLAQVLWIENGSVRKFFVIVDAELKMQYFVDCRDIPILKKQLRANDAEVFDNFTKYSQQFRKRFGLQSSKALDLFNQTVSIKEIGGLNDFVREHMLEKADVRTKIDELQESYENLTISHTAIQKARQQLDALQPLTKEAKKYKKLAREVSDLQQFQAVLPAFFAKKSLALLAFELKGIEQDLIQAAQERAQSDRTLTALRDQEKDLDFAIKQDTVGQRLQALTREIEQAQKAVTIQQAQANEYDQLTKRLGLGGYSDSEAFYVGRAQGEALGQEIELKLERLLSLRDERKLEEADLQRQQQQLSDELTSLRNRKSQIPASNLAIRDRLTQALNLAGSELPFIGERVRVRPEAQEWEGAIERLLRGFGLCLLVPDEHYNAVNAYVNKTHLRGRLVYYRVGQAKPRVTQRTPNPAQVPYRIEIRPDELFLPWLRERLSQQFNYVCCDSIEQFQREVKAITRTGLIKQGKGRHEKDDRSRIDDRTRYILGWDNASKIEALEAELAVVNQSLTKLAKQLKEIETEQGQRRSQQAWLQDFMRFADFANIDWKTAAQGCQTLQAQKQTLEASSDRLKQLELQLKDVQADIATVNNSRDRIIGALQSLEDRQRQAKAQQARCEQKLTTVKTADIEDFETKMAKQLKPYKLTLETLVDDESAMKDVVQKQLILRQRQQSESRGAIERCLFKFKQAFPEATLELGTTYEYLDEYLNMKTQIEQDDLPRHEERFKQLMNDKVIIAISMFKSDLEKQEEEIEAAIVELNESLHQIDYTESTYIELCCDTTRNQEIRDFKGDLKACLGDAARQSAEDNEERFQKIRTRLIERFKNEERWTKLVTDVRKWLDFSVSERYRADNSEKEHHTDSSGKSGGQKVKLAYTILASVIAYQFGLNPAVVGADRPDSTDRAKAKSFRFVVIDEAFSKSDDSNARYAMELFKNLNLQLLVITPKDKINVIEPYIDSLHFVSNTPAGDYSKIASISIEDYRTKRQASLVSVS